VIPPGIWADVVDLGTGKRYGGMECRHGVPRVGDFLLTREPRGRDVTEPVTWVKIESVAWLPDRVQVVLAVVPAACPSYVDSGTDGT
jgi:hypothetical protein